MVQLIGRTLNGRTAAICAMAIPTAVFGIAAWSRRWMSDDGYICLRVVRQLLEGNGLIYNRGERVEAATSPMWVGLLSLGKEVFRPVALPWLAVVLGLALSIAGLALAQWGAYRLWTRGRQRIVVPVGAVVVAATPAFWDYATSGLETGLSFAWLGACFWGLTSLLRSEGAVAAAEDGAEALPLQTAAQRAIPAWLPIIIGLGLLVRPDFILFTLPFVAAMFVARRPRSLRDVVVPLGLAFALPLLYEVFRAGYYAELVPNPAFAKEASMARWSQGWFYLWDTERTYWLAVPLALAFITALPSWLSSTRSRAFGAVIAAPVAGGLAHGLYSVYVGGDFMHARILLPAVFALLMPVAVLGIDSVLTLAPLAGLAAWAIVCATTLRPSYDGIGPRGIANERAYYVRNSGNAHPITIQDYARYGKPAEIGAAQLPQHSLLLGLDAGRIPMRSDVKADRVMVNGGIGIFGWAVGDDVYVFDIHGLANPLASRLKLTGRGRPGHEKWLPDAWIIALYTDPTTSLPTLLPMHLPPPGDIAAARTALHCEDISELLAAVSDPLTPGRFAHNLLDAFRLHRFRFSGDPYTASHEQCGEPETPPLPQ